MLEASFLGLSDRLPEDGAVSVWPAWEVWEGGVVTAWFQVRLAFADGAVVEALAVVADGNVSLEDVRARPALALDDLAVLADWLEVPLFEACGIAAGPAQGRGREADEAEMVGEGAAGHRGAEVSEVDVSGAGVSGADVSAVDIGVAGEGEGDAGAGAGGEEGADASDASDASEASDAADAAEAAGPRRARPPWPRGIEGRWLVAQAYRTAQEEGTDPVLAVMCATGHSRRRSLRLIAQARDAGFLTPRHARRG
ncbi:DUF6214 family protein [Streptomyces sp. NPDC052687]|uniref:DUF6214 family protein n=1 Tax=Streptomyces sp. NPDC052687 TaxID=3154759 RepID=UPI00342F1030